MAKGGFRREGRRRRGQIRKLRDKPNVPDGMLRNVVDRVIHIVKDERRKLELTDSEREYVDKRLTPVYHEILGYYENKAPKLNIPFQPASL